MPRGFKRDEAATAEAYETGRLTDKRKRSFISREGHELLAGEDKSRRRSEVMERDKGLCQGCPKPHFVGAMGEWDHIKSGNSGRCDCLHNGRWVCAAFHRRRHLRPRLNWLPSAADLDAVAAEQEIARRTAKSSCGT